MTRASPNARGTPIVFAVLAAAFAFGAFFHLAALVWPSLAPDSPAWRHALFVLINITVAVGMVARPRYFPAVFAILCIQQIASHGDAAHRAWRDERSVDFASVAVLIVMPLAFALLLVDRERHRETRA